MRKPSKYKAVRTVVDGISFASKKEAKRYGELKLLEKAGMIDQLVLQEPFKLKVDGHLICTYYADFTYLVKGKTRLVREDVKGVRTEVYRIKKKLMKAIYGIEILET